MPSPGKGHPVPIRLRQGHDTDTPQVLPPPPPPRSVFQQIVSTGSWEDGTRVCTALASSCLGRGGRVPRCSAGAMDRRRAGTPRQLTQCWATMSPSPSCPGHLNTALRVGQGGLGEVVLFLSVFFCNVPNVRWKTSPCLTPAASCTTKSSAEHPKPRLKWAGVPKAPRNISIINNVPLVCKQRKARRCSSIYLRS